MTEAMEDIQRLLTLSQPSREGRDMYTQPANSAGLHLGRFLSALYLEERIVSQSCPQNTAFSINHGGRE